MEITSTHIAGSVFVLLMIGFFIVGYIVDRRIVAKHRRSHEPGYLRGGTGKVATTMTRHNRILTALALTGIIIGVTAILLHFLTAH